MALIANWSDNFLEISLDGDTDFDIMTSLIGLGSIKNASKGIRVRKIIFVPSKSCDTLIIRDTQNGPMMFAVVNVLGIHDIVKYDYREDSHIDKGKLVKPYIHANECVVGVENEAYVIFEL